MLEIDECFRAGVSHRKDFFIDKSKVDLGPHGYRGTATAGILKPVLF